MNPYGYTGREMDADDLYYYRARYYDPNTQRFLSLDPIGFHAGDFNFYRYVGNDPVNFRDPSGLIDMNTTKEVGKTIGEGAVNAKAFNTSGGWIHDAIEHGFTPDNIVNWRDHVIPKLQGEDPASQLLRQLEEEKTCKVVKKTQAKTKEEILKEQKKKISEEKNLMNA